MISSEVVDAMHRGLEWLRRRQLECGGWVSCDASQTGLTGLIVLAFREAGFKATDILIVSAVRFITSKQKDNGALQWGPGGDSIPGTARALLAVLVNSPEENRPRLLQTVNKSINFFASAELPSGGWEGTRGGGTAYWASAEVLYTSWLAGRIYNNEVWWSPMPYYVGFRRWFLQGQTTLGAWDNNCIDCTARVAFFLNLFRENLPETSSALNFLAAQQKADGRIGDSPWATAWSVLAMLATPNTSIWSDVIDTAVGALLESQMDDGSWPIFYESDVSYESTTALAVWALAAYRNRAYAKPLLLESVI